MASIIEALQTNYINITLSDGFVFSLADKVLYIDYFEDIMSPGVTLNMFVSSSESIVQGLKIRGGERIDINLNVASGTFQKDEEYSFYVYKVSNLNSSDTAENFNIHCVTKGKFG